MAETLGVHRPTVSVVARSLQRAGIIRYRRGAITIADRFRLEKAGFCAGPAFPPDGRTIAAGFGTDGTKAEASRTEIVTFDVASGEVLGDQAVVERIESIRKADPWKTSLARKSERLPSHAGARAV